MFFAEQGVSNGTYHDWPAACCPLVSYVAYAPRYRRRRQTTTDITDRYKSGPPLLHYV